MGDYGHILGQLSKCKRSGTARVAWTACCPAHEDRHPSLYLWIGRHGELMARCMANRGCTWPKIAGAIDTRPEEWWPPKSEAERREARREWARRQGRMPDDIECCYDYRDENGRLLFQCVRYRRPHQPRFRQRQPLRDGGWRWNLDGVQLVPYRLPELLARPQHPVIVVEGEKDVETLRGLGLTATTGPCGSSAWRPDYARWLRGRRVVVLPDNDEPGERYAAMVAGSCLQWGAASVRVVRLIGLPEGGDVTDWVEDRPEPAGGRDEVKEALVACILDAAEYRSTAFYPTEDSR